VRFIVDDQDCVQFSRSHDAARIPSALRWPAIVHQNFLDAAPPDQRAGFQALLLAVRTTQHPSGYQFQSSHIPGEMRAVYAQPVAKHPGWVSLAVFDIAAEIELPDALKTAGACIVALVQAFAACL
jgi:hypothetical protein